LSERHAIAVGNDGLVIYSTDGFITWKLISHTELDAMGNGNVISGLKLSNIYAVDSNVPGYQQEFSIVGDVKGFSGGIQQGQSKVFSFHAPYFFNRANNFVLEASGSILLSGDLRINDNGNVFTNSNSISLFPDVATEINIGNTLIGGNTNIKHNLDVVFNAHVYQKLIVDSYSFLNDDVSLNGKLYVTKDASLNSNLFVGRDASFGSKFYLVGDASLNSRMFVGKDVSLGANLYLVDDASFNSRLYVGKDVSLNSKLYVVDDVSMNSRLFVGQDVSFGAKFRVAGKSAFESDVSINANLFVIDVSGRHLDLRGTRNSDGVGSGALIVQGGASIGNDLNVGGNLYINNYLDVVDGTDHIHFGYTNTRKMYIGSSDFTDEIRIGTSISGVRGEDVDIYIGSETNSRVHILGNLLVPGQVIFANQTNLEIINKNILLNDQAAPGMSYGAGIYIREDNSDLAGQILVNPNMSGFVLKAPRSTNVVNFETNAMVLPPGLGRGIITIVPTTTLDGSNYTIARGVVDISDIEFLDASLNNRLMRNPVTTATQVNTQVINGQLSMSGLYVNKLEATVIGNAQVDISGNAIVSRMGLGSSVVRPEYVLDISGNAFSNGAILQW
jgi:acetyltransferase-like isoleucine patch superfamily enzyme